MISKISADNVIRPMFISCDNDWEQHSDNCFGHKNGVYNHILCFCNHTENMPKCTILLFYFKIFPGGNTPRTSDCVLGLKTQNAFPHFLPCCKRSLTELDAIYRSTRRQCIFSSENNCYFSLVLVS